MQEFEIRNFFYNAMADYGLVCGKKELNIAGLRIDIFAIDEKHNPYIIEFKKDKNRHIVGQSAQYLALVPTYKEQIQNELNFSNINWSNLNVLCIAEKFRERDYKAAEYEPLKGKVHFYVFKIIRNTRNKIFSLNLDYMGPCRKTESPLKIPRKIIDKCNIKQLCEGFFNIKKEEERREYYSTKILPLLKQIGSGLSEFASIGMYPHYSFWEKSKSFALRLGTHKTKFHRESIIIGFSDDSIYCGFDLTHSLEEARKLSLLLKDKDKLNMFAGKLNRLEGYSLYLSDTGINISMLLDDISIKGFEMLLKTTIQKHSEIVTLEFRPTMKKNP
jgi:hypothetical protein